jgi:phosphate transport system substrate-binding protein
LLRLTIVLLLLVGGCGTPQSGESQSLLTLAGSTSVAPFIELVAEAYLEEHTGVLINVQAIGSGAGIKAAIAGTTDMGMSSRDLKSEEAQTLTPILIARDAIAIIVHPDNPLHNLSLKQTQAIFAGRVTNWQEMGGPNREITLVSREEGSGTREAFQKLVMGDEEVTSRSLRQGSNGAIRAIVANDPYAIGYISLGIVDETVRAISIDGVDATVENVETGRYTLVRPFLLVHVGDLSSLEEDFVTFTLSSAGQAILTSQGLVGAGGD